MSVSELIGQKSQMRTAQFNESLRALSPAVHETLNGFTGDYRRLPGVKSVIITGSLVDNVANNNKDAFPKYLGTKFKLAPSDFDFVVIVDRQEVNQDGFRPEDADNIRQVRDGTINMFSWNFPVGTTRPTPKFFTVEAYRQLAAFEPASFRMRRHNSLVAYEPSTRFKTTGGEWVDHVYEETQQPDGSYLLKWNYMPFHTDSSLIVTDLHNMVLKGIPLCSDLDSVLTQNEMRKRLLKYLKGEQDFLDVLSIKTHLGDGALPLLLPLTS